MASSCSIIGSANQIFVADGGTDFTLSLPQDIAALSSPVFENVQFNALTINKVVFTDNAKKLKSYNLAGTADQVILVNDDQHTRGRYRSQLEHRRTSRLEV